MKEKLDLEMITPIVGNSPASPLIEGSMFAPLAVDSDVDVPLAYLSSLIF